MVVYFGGLKQAKEMYYRGRKIREAWYGGERVFSGKPVEVMPAVSGSYDARDWLRAKLTEYGEDYRTVEELPFEIDSSQVTTMREMFRGCSSLTTVPEMDTSQVTTMHRMFRACSSLTTVPEMDTSQVTTMREMFRTCSSLIAAPQMDTSNVTDMYEMFYVCRALTTVPDMHTSQVTNMSYMFQDCSSLTDGNVRLIGKNSRVSTSLMIYKSGLTREPFYDISGQPI